MPKDSLSPFLARAFCIPCPCPCLFSPSVECCRARRTESVASVRMETTTVQVTWGPIPRLEKYDAFVAHLNDSLASSNPLEVAARILDARSRVRATSEHS